MKPNPCSVLFHKSFAWYRSKLSLTKVLQIYRIGIRLYVYTPLQHFCQIWVFDVGADQIKLVLIFSFLAEGFWVNIDYYLERFI